MARTLQALPRIILSFCQRGYTWSQVLSEFIDNSLGEAAGNAQSVTIWFDPDRIWVADDGRGIDDLNRLATLGDSNSYSHGSDIGQYGVGSKVFLDKADVLDIETYYEGRRHHHTFDFRPILKAIKLDQDAKWIEAYEGKGRIDTSKKGTMLVMRNLRDYKGLQMRGLKATLERKFWPALEQGREIVLIDCRHREERHPLEVMKPESLSDVIEFAGAVNGREYRATVGILSDQVGTYGGLHLGYTHRNVCVEKVLATRALPSRIHGRVELLSGWRDTLNNTKDAITTDRDELLVELEAQLADLIKLADSYTEDLFVDNVALKINRKLAMVPLQKAGDRKKVRPEPNPDAPKKKKPELGVKKPKRERKPPKVKPEGQGNEPQTVSGLSFTFRHMGESDVATVEPKGAQFLVVLNRDCPKMKPMMKQTRWPGIFLAIANALAWHCLTQMQINEIREFFGALPGMDSVVGEKPEEMKQEMAKRVQTYIAFHVGEDENEETDSTDAESEAREA